VHRGERSGKTQAGAFQGPDPDACRDPRVAQVELSPRRDPKQSALETGGVAGGEQLNDKTAGDTNGEGIDAFGGSTSASVTKAASTWHGG
jgi:hypothetical protein